MTEFAQHITANGDTIYYDPSVVNSRDLDCDFIPVNLLPGSTISDHIAVFSAWGETRAVRPLHFTVNPSRTYIGLAAAAMILSVIAFALSVVVLLRP